MTMHEDAHVSNCMSTWEQQCMVFVKEARAHYQLNTIIADFDGTPIGSASMHMLLGLYPRVFSAIRKTGYIWGV
ncbi:hypothetical protein WJX77_003929 [Trebouxia sp. C0004]